ncbi:MAG: Lrp/AsnC family transcriptional regulator [Chloroflexota bacterium]
MDEKTNKLLDDTGWKLLQELQNNARLSYTELGQRVGLSTPAVTERVRKMEDAGIITGYHAKVDLGKVGLPMMAIVYIKDEGGQRGETKVAQIKQIPEVVELYRTTGCDSIIVKVVAPSIEQLAVTLDQLSHTGTPSMSVVLGRPLIRNVISDTLSVSNSI